MTHPPVTDFSDPLAIVRGVFDAINTEDWPAAAALVDPVSLRVFAQNLRERLAPEVPQGSVTAEEYMRADPQLPRAVAVHYAAQSRRDADPTWRLQHELPGVGSPDALRTMAPEEVFARWLEGGSARRQMRRLAAEGRISQHGAETLDVAMRYVAVGVVPDGPQLAHVLYRHDIDPEQPWSGDLANWLARMPADEQVLARELSARGNPSVAIVRRQGRWNVALGR